MTDAKKGRLSIGFTPGRGSEMFTHVYPPFTRLIRMLSWNLMN